MVKRVCWLTQGSEATGTQEFVIWMRQQGKDLLSLKPPSSLRLSGIRRHLLSFPDNDLTVDGPL